MFWEIHVLESFEPSTHWNFSSQNRREMAAPKLKIELCGKALALGNICPIRTRRGCGLCWAEFLSFEQVRALDQARFLVMRPTEASKTELGSNIGHHCGPH